MSEDVVREKLVEVFAVVLKIPPESVTEDLSPDSCATWDSLHHVHLVSVIDEVFGITLTFEQQMEIMTFDLARDVVREAVAGK
jgi:acyl carrier protein